MIYIFSLYAHKSNYIQKIKIKLFMQDFIEKIISLSFLIILEKLKKSFDLEIGI